MLSYHRLGGALPQLNQEWLNDVGRWAQGTGAGYVRTQLFRVRHIQQLVASLGRAVSSEPSRLAEEDVHAEWPHHSCNRGCDDQTALKQVLCLTSFVDEERRVRNFQELDVKANAACEEDEALVDERLLEEVSSSLEANDPPLLPLGVFVLSISQRTNFKRLHITGACPRAPGVHYKHFQVLGTEEPSARAFDARCLHCFPLSKGVVESADAVEAQSPSTSDSSSESGTEQ